MERDSSIDKEIVDKKIHREIDRSTDSEGEKDRQFCW